MNIIVSSRFKYYCKKFAKIALLLLVSFLLIVLFIYLRYKPLYKVTLNGRVIGYVENKEMLEQKINEFANNLEDNVTSIKIAEMPEFELELVNGIKESETKETEIIAMIEEQADITVRTYAIKLDGNEKACVNSKEEAESIISEIKAGVTEGVELDLTIEEQEKNKKDLILATSEIAKADINKDVEVKVQEYEKKKAEEEATRAAAAQAATRAAMSSRATTSSRSASIPATGAKFMRPITGGTITSVYGRRSSGFHTGLDFAAATGTPIYASASGTVVLAGSQGNGYGKYVIIDHGNGYQTYYAHCSAIYVTAGQYVNQGENIAAVGSTGNSTGPHVHFEIRYNGNTLNPQNYI